MERWMVLITQKWKIKAMLKNVSFVFLQSNGRDYFIFGISIELDKLRFQIFILISKNTHYKN